MNLLESFKVHIIASFLIGLLCCLCVPVAVAAESDSKPSILIVGTPHFRNVGLDMVNIDIESVMSPKRQAEIEQFVSLVGAYLPTHIAIEFPTTSQLQIDEAYAAYLNDNLELREIEQHQLGYRLGKHAGLSQIFGVDWNEYPPGDPEDYDWVTFGQEHMMQDRIEQISDPDSTSRPNFSMADESITEWLERLNSPDTLEMMHRVYFDIAGIHSDGSHPGADWVGTWYARNLKILNNIRSLVSQGDRVVVFYGLGHAYLLNQLAKESGYFDVDSLTTVLNQ